MNEERTVTRLKDIVPNIYGDDERPEPIVERSAQPSAAGPFEAGLLYIAADLEQLAKTAPSAKEKSVLALVRLMRALAEP